MVATARKERAPIAILGAGKLGGAIARGIISTATRPSSALFLTHLDEIELDSFEVRGCRVGTDNRAAIAQARIVIVAVLPRQLPGLLDEIRDALDPSRHLLVSTVTGVTIDSIRRKIGTWIPVVRAMPNLGVQTLASMTCLATDEGSAAVLPEVESLFEVLGETVVIREEDMSAATALCASGIAFFLRAIRAASQAGVQIGFHAEDAIRMSAQTALGAAELLLAKEGGHPEKEIDEVTTPAGCTIAGLNEMESRGFSAALTQGIIAAARKAGTLGLDADSSFDGARSPNED